MPADVFWPVAWRVAALLAAGAFAIVALNLASAAKRRRADEGERKRKARSSLWPRFWVWVIAVVLLLGAAGLGPIGFGLLIAVLSIQAVGELSDALRRCDIAFDARPPMVAASLTVLSAAIFGATGAYAAIGVAALALPAAVLLRGGEHSPRTVAAAFAGAAVTLYVAAPLAILVALLDLANGFALVAWLLIVVVLSDTFAMFGGLAFGRRPLVPCISPGKTVEGVAAGLLGALAGAALLHFAFPDASWAGFYLAALAVALTGLVGDLAASCIKRAAGLDDFSTFLPGHGGLMDRLDSILFGVPVVLILLLLGAFG